MKKSNFKAVFKSVLLPLSALFVLTACGTQPANSAASPESITSAANAQAALISKLKAETVKTKFQPATWDKNYKPADVAMLMSDLNRLSFYTSKNIARWFEISGPDQTLPLKYHRRNAAPLAEILAMSSKTVGFISLVREVPPPPVAQNVVMTIEGVFHQFVDQLLNIGRNFGNFLRKLFPGFRLPDLLQSNEIIIVDIVEKTPAANNFFTFKESRKQKIEVKKLKDLLKRQGLHTVELSPLD